MRHVFLSLAILAETFAGVDQVHLVPWMLSCAQGRRRTFLEPFLGVPLLSHHVMQKNSSGMSMTWCYRTKHR